MNEDLLKVFSNIDSKIFESDPNRNWKPGLRFALNKVADNRLVRIFIGWVTSLS